MSNNEINLIIEEISSYNQFSDIGIEKIVDVEIGYAFRIAKFSKNMLKINQLRGIVDTLDRIEQSEKTWKDKRIEFYLLKPRFALGVSKKIISPELYDVLCAAMKLVDVSDDNQKNIKNFKFFVYFFESIIAYYKFLEV